MSECFNIYCDESCHLENDKINIMTLGAIWIPKNEVKRINREIREIKKKHNINPYAEIKWVKVSPSKTKLYLNLVDYFFKNKELHFRVIIIPDKSQLKHEFFDQTHDDFYYKMYFNLLKVIWQPFASYNIYLDIKDTLGYKKIKILHEVLCSHHYDYKQDIIEKVQLVRSHEVDILQLTDLLLGAVTYKNRNLKSSETKLAIIKRIQDWSKYSLSKSTYLSERKFNIFRWEAQNEIL